MMPPTLLSDAIPPHSHPVFTTTIVLLVAVFAIVIAALMLWQRRQKRLLEERNEQLQALAEHMPGVAYTYESHPERPRKLLYLGPGLEELIGRDATRRVRARYDHIFELIHPDDRQRLRDRVSQSHEENRPVDLELRLKRDDGDYVWIRTISRPTDMGGGVARWHGVMFDVSASKRVESALRQNEATIRALCEATAAGDATSQQRIGNLLEVGCAAFELEIGVLAQIEGDRYTVVACRAPADFGVDVGSEFDLEITFSRDTMEVDQPVFFGNVNGGDLSERRAYREYGVQAYLGTRVLVQDRRFGTLNFASRKARARPFIQSELDLLGLMARWVGREIERDNARRELQWAHDNLGHEVRQRTAELLAINTALREQVQERERAEEELQHKHDQERLLFSELDHRVRNNLSSLISLLDLTRRQSNDLDDFVSSIRGRIEAMAAVHGILSQSHWRTMQVRDIVGVLCPSGMEAAVETRGDDVEISSRQANAFGMVLHELMANSLKYGALSRVGGRVHLDWQIATGSNGESKGRLLHLSWRETGGPPIARVEHHGSGTSIIEGLVHFELRGTLVLGFPREGACHRFSIMLDDVDEAEEANRQFAGRSAD